MRKEQYLVEGSSINPVLRFQKNTIVELLILFLYKHLLEFLFIPSYLKTWGYMYNNFTYNSNYTKTAISDIMLLLLILVYYLHRNKSNMYDFAFKLLICLSIIPALALYSTNANLSLSSVFYPCLYFLVFAVFINIIPNKTERIKIKIGKIQNIDRIVLWSSFAFVIVFWMYLGFPVALSVDDAYEQRMLMRTKSLPSLVNYLYLMLGNAIIPYLFVKFLMNKKPMSAAISFITGLLLFFSNGMKTWLILYFLGFALLICARLFKYIYSRIVISIEFFFCAIILLSWMLYSKMDFMELHGQLGRILLIPSNIGYKYISFFSDPSNELLYLRESILKFFFQSPYSGGSDFYINYGANSTLTSARANNGLWGDAYRNFATIGVIFYPILLIFVIKIIISNMKKQRMDVQLFVILLLIWSSINSSFFTWLLTGGIILLTIILKTENDKENKDENN